MANQDLVSYIRRALASGATKEKIKSDLLGAGWQEGDASAGFAEIEGISAAPAVPAAPVAPPQISQSVQYPQTFQNIQTPPAEAPRFSAGWKTSTPRFRVSGKIVAAIFSVIAVVALAGGAGYMYITKLGPFSRPPYAENNILSGVLGGISRIDTSSYSFSATLSVGSRDAGAEPFTIKRSDEAEFKKQYKRDIKRTNDISAIMNNLRYSGLKTFPKSLQESLQTKTSYGYYGSKPSAIDPLSKKSYEYSLTDGGKNFSLSITFETKEAISLLKGRLNQNSSNILISGQKATFTKDSNAYLYFPSEPPKPFLAQIGEMLSFLPVEIKATSAIKAQADWKNTDSSEWKFNAMGEGDFGDMTYKADVDALKKGGIYYFKVNNMPSLILSLFGNVKGQWIKIDPAQASSTAQSIYGSSYFYSISSFQKMEKTYKEQRKKIYDFLKKAIEIADSENLVALKNQPVNETVDDRQLYRYDLKIRKEAVISFYKKIIAEANGKKLGREIAFIADEEYLHYLESPEFDEIFDYYDKNITLTLWADAQGFPAVVDYSIRIVPPDTATQLKDKQINILFKLALTDINVPVDIKKPDNAKSLDELSGGAISGSLDEARKKSRDARRLMDTKQLQVALELYFDANNSNYPSDLGKLTAKNACGKIVCIASLPKDPDQSDYYYAVHTSSKGTRDSYHIGADLESDTNSALDYDADCNSVTESGCGQVSGGTWKSTGMFTGDDSAGCGGKLNRYCYDANP